MSVLPPYDLWKLIRFSLRKHGSVISNNISIEYFLQFFHPFGQKQVNLPLQMGINSEQKGFHINCHPKTTTIGRLPILYVEEIYAVNDFGFYLGTGVAF